MAEDADQSKWKTKYLESLETLESRESEWSLTDQTLRRGLSRIALVSQGVDDQLDQYLNRLRKDLQAEVPARELSQLIEQITVYVKSLDDRIDSTDTVERRALLDPVGALLQLVDAIRFPSRVESQLWKLRAGLKVANAADHLNELIDEFSRLIAMAFYARESVAEEPVNRPLIAEAVVPVAPAQAPQKKRQSWWQRLFFFNASSDDSAAAKQRPLDNPNQEPVSKQFNQSPAMPQRTTAVVQAGVAIESVFMEFLERLNFPPEFSDRVQQLRSQLTAGLKVDAIKSMTRSIVSLVIEMRSLLQQEKEELELFLQQLTQRLQELDSMVEGAESNRRASFESGRRLDAAVEAQVNEIETTVQSESDLSQMKNLIQGSLENIRQHFAEQRQQEGLRQQELESQLKAMTERLQVIEGESQQLRQRLADEREQALTDPLTSAPNRLAYERRMAQEFARWQRYQNPLTMILCDVDFFKRINDSYGHKAGDRALVAITQAITQQLRGTDFLARIGGEEFVVLLTETSLDDARAVAEKLRASVEGCEFVYEGKSVPITLSGGLAQFASGDEVDAVYQRADKALYRAKHQGRNQFQTE